MDIKNQNFLYITGVFLQEPFNFFIYKVVETFYSQEYLIVKIIKFVVAWILFYYSGVIISASNLLGKAIAYLSKKKEVRDPYTAPDLCLVNFNIKYDELRVDQDHLHFAPPPITDLELTDDQKLIDVKNLIDMYEQVNNRYCIPGTFQKLCKVVSSNESQYVNGYQASKTLLEQTSKYLKFFISQMQTDQVNQDTKKKILGELEKAAPYCPAKWLEVAARLYREINTGVKETAQIKLLKLVQNYKEALLEHKFETEGKQWHALTEVRIHLGSTLGLNKDLSKFDVHVRNHISLYEMWQNKKYFLDKYTNVANLISAIQEAIYSENPLDYQEFFTEILKEYNTNNLALDEDGDDFLDLLSEYYYEQNHPTKAGQLNDAAIIHLLMAIGVLK